MYGSKVLAKCNLDTTFSSMVEIKSGQRCGGVIRFATSTKRFGGETFFFQSTKVNRDLSWDSSRHSRRFCEHLRSFRCLCKEVVSVAD